MNDPKILADRFPGDFVFGVATAAFQIEGATKLDGRKPSIWDAFANMPGRVYGRHNGDVACDHYNRLEEDLDLIQSLGVSAYRFSIAWPRVIPEGTGPVNEKGLDFYDRLVDGLKARGIKAFATLYHWDLPLMLAGDGGWTERQTAYAYQRYAKTVIARLGDRLDAVATFNEPWCSVWLSHLYGIHAPGERNMDAALHALHFTNLAHGLGVAAIRAERPQLATGLVLNAHSIYAGSAGEADLAAATRAFDFHNGVFFGPVFKGEYPESFLSALGDRMPAIEPGDMETISQPLDWWGLNYYTPMRVAHDVSEGAEFPATVPAPPVTDIRTDIGWEVFAPALGDLIRKLNADYALPACYITENGACYNMEVENGAVDDQPRLDYIAEHLGVTADLIREGYPMRGYFAWSLMDNFEWAEGYRMRFGIVHVDYGTQVRTVKKSGKWYAELAGAFPKGNHRAA
ncbi:MULTISPECIES: GH1 family beta-glucosidase [unclassified Shinella]|uniref:GH1 family beta-glucosidase n=1 Tax=unclassified Shinella TaxID=2643062 RepID=UPI00234F44FF|nr:MULTISPECIES: GH1 family beta-glucosidase [unclassified Shinella]MCO5150609.1 GH1 family beta-glucosidase [Shinella sp.]MDC7263380.1 beta-glucosidase [Shinella sp. HY16]MDC7270275.1 beta-glucosidase [Shinella sp. YZ44]